jgi:hypothetical protein
MFNIVTGVKFWGDFIDMQQAVDGVKPERRKEE